MSTNTLFILELILFDGMAVAWGAWEFWSARPTKTSKPEDCVSLAGESPEDPGHPER